MVIKRQQYIDDDEEEAEETAAATHGTNDCSYALLLVSGSQIYTYFIYSVSGN